MKFLGLFVSLFVVGGQSAAGAQSISGDVSGYGRPIAGAEVRLLELDRTTHTNADGRFSFRDVPLGSYTIYAAAKGFSSETKRVTLAININVGTSLDLLPSAIPLKEVVVTASPFPRAVDEQYQSTASKS
ncbi:MAG TPA: carboxypeptidase regulatory-like domain-containing protein, partial [Gemmatimonadaceae bacterium]|nr:carboxypeptidase regulatory-like domain-containing protein [Gemmatimonadaceae bacterium]